MLLYILACGGGQPERPASTPTTPTVEFPTTDEVVVTNLDGFLPKVPAALPATLASIRPGQPAGEARAALERLRYPNARIFSAEGERTLAYGTILADAPSVMVTVVVGKESQLVEEIDLALPGEAVVPLVTSAWGEPDAVVYGDGGSSVSRWTPGAGPWWAELRPNPDEADLLRFFPAGKPYDPNVAQPSKDAMPPPASH